MPPKIEETPIPYPDLNPDHQSGVSIDLSKAVPEIVLTQTSPYIDLTIGNVALTENIDYGPDDVPERRALLDLVGKPYHVHYEEGSEGYKLNPEGAEHNLDASLVLTYLVQNKQTIPKKTKAPLDPLINWFFEKYPDSDLNSNGLSSPTNVVRNWLHKLGPHNELFGSEEDLKSAKLWLTQTNDEKYGDSVEAKKSREFRLIADINLELVEQTENDEEKLLYLSEASSFLQQTRDDNILNEEFGYAAQDQATLTYARIEMQRIKLLGSSWLRGDFEESAKDEFYKKVDAESRILGAFIARGLENVVEKVEGVAQDSDHSELDRARKNLAMAYEAVTYLLLINEMQLEKAMPLSRARPGTMRQEAGTTHHIITPSGRKSSGFNFNFDIEFDNVNKKNKKETTYIQLKVNPDHTNDELAKQASTSFFSGKTFRYLAPIDTLGIELPDDAPSYNSALIALATSMHKLVENETVNN